MSDSNAEQAASVQPDTQEQNDANTQQNADEQEQQQQPQSQQGDEQQQQQQPQDGAPQPDGQQQSSVDDGQQQHDSHSLAMQQQHHAMQAMMMGGSPMQHFDIDEFEAQQQMLHAHLSGAAVGAHPMQLLQAQREQDQINQQANGMMPQQGGNMGGIEICRAYLAGRCSRGAACRFVHVENSGGHAPPNPHLCRDWLNGTCQRGAGCRFQHQGLSGSKASIHAGASKAGPWSMKHSVICHQWASRGRCDYGTACKFSHQRGEKPWNESALDEKKLLAAMLSGLSPQEALSQALNSLQASNPSKFGPMDPNAVNGVQAAALNGNNANSPNGAAVGPNGLVPQMDGSGMPNPQQMNGMPPLGPQKRADGSLILCRFYARHGYCKYGVACKFAHAPSLGGAGVFPQVGPNGMVMPGYGGDRAPQQGANGQSLASLLALGLKASMMSQESLIANHAALLAANAMNGGQPNGQVGVPRVNSPSAMQNGQLPPMDPALASVISAYLQGQQPAMPQQGLATLLQQLQGGNGAANSGNPNSLSPTAQLGYGNFQPDSQSSDAFQAFMQQQQQQNAFNNAFSPAAASAFNAIPNTNTAAANGGATAGNASGAGANGGSSGANGSGNNGANLTLPQMISTAFRSSSNGSNGSGNSSGNGPNANGSANGNASSLSNNLSLMSLKPFSDDDAAAYTNDNTAQEVHGRSNSSSFNDASSSFSSPSLLAADARSPDNFGNYSAGTSNANNTIIGGGMGNGTLSALFSSSLNGPFLH